MKKTVRGIMILLCISVVAVNAPAISAGAENLIGKCLFGLHVATLYFEPPDEKLQMPVEGVTRRQITDSWHAPREGDRLHEGQDIFSKRGTRVLSATDGYVLRVGENHLGGHTVSVIGAGARIYYYAHLDSYAPIAVGDHVTTETLLGYVGNTGDAAGGPTHLHFGVYASGGAVNPLPLLVDRPEKRNLKAR